MLKIAFIGLGNMGYPMAVNLLGAGFEVTVQNRTRSKAESLAPRGAIVADSPAEAARDADLVLACLASVEQSRELFLGEGGIVRSARPGQVLADHATVDLETSRAVHAAARDRGASFLDAPISGGPGGAAEATLSIMVGGDANAFDRALPAFSAMGKTIVHMGPAGAGTATKLANQLLVSTHSLAICEAFLLARTAGVDLEKLFEVLRNSWGSSRMLERNAPRLIQRDFGPSAAPLRNLHKDVSIILRFARENGLTLPSAAEADRVYSTLLGEGKAEWDLTAALLLLERWAGRAIPEACDP
ncbi:MAG TPA: NAD(P)-dependent oxidoreductase [Planctomycetota bacterium]|nr:NAD(P)-dependent oxidoreductase [Planctomycetota bacterium]